MPTVLERLRSPGPASLTLASAALVFLAHWVGVPLFDLIELRTYDLRFQSRGAVAPAPEVVLAVVDEKSLDALGRWPWSRSRMAALVDALSTDGARVIAFDIGFLEPEAPGPDAALARAIARSPADVVLGYFFHMEESQTTYRVDPIALERGLEQLGTTALTVRYRDSDPDESPFLPAYAPEGNLPELAAAAEGAGFFTLLPDEDGVLRRTPLVIQAGEEVYPSLALATAWQALGRPALVVEVAQNRVAGIRLGERMLPADSHGRLLLAYPGPAKTFPHVSIADILAGELPPGHFRNRVVLIGVTATAIFDLRVTPFGSVYPGLEVQATAIDNLLTGRFVTRPGWASVADQLAIVALGVLTGLLLSRLGALSGLLAAGLLAAGYVALARQLFVSAGAWLGVTYPLLALGTTYVAITAHAYLSEQRERRKVVSAFGQYVSPVVIEQMLARPDQLRLGGEERVLTVLFCDMAGFTGIAERLTPQQTIELLSEYHACMTERIFACEGMLKEYVGDELMAIFGAPVAQPEHAVRACRAALELRAARAEFSIEWAKRGYPPIRSRTGVNSGAMLVGNVGSRYRFSYGVVGDAVNLASRLEGMNKMYGTEILIGEQTAAMAGDAFRLREVDSVRVLGKRLAVRIYELVGEAGETLDPGREKAFGHHAAGLIAYRERRFDAALIELEAALALAPGAGPSRTLGGRCQLYRAAPPAPDWDGVFEATEK
jgi:adenylate cyclase